MVISVCPATGEAQRWWSSSLDFLDVVKLTYLSVLSWSASWTFLQQAQELVGIVTAGVREKRLLIQGTGKFLKIRDFTARPTLAGESLAVMCYAGYGGPSEPRGDGQHLYLLFSSAETHRGKQEAAQAMFSWHFHLPLVLCLRMFTRVWERPPKARVWACGGESLLQQRSWHFPFYDQVLSFRSCQIMSRRKLRKTNARIPRYREAEHSQDDWRRWRCNTKMAKRCRRPHTENWRLLPLWCWHYPAARIDLIDMTIKVYIWTFSYFIFCFLFFCDSVCNSSATRAVSGLVLFFFWNILIERSTRDVQNYY